MAVVRANNRMGIRGVMAAGRARGGYAGGGGGGGAGKSVMGPFGDENERESGGFIGPFGWGGGLTEGAQAARAAHAQFNEDEQNALGNLSNELAQGKSIGEALRSNPEDLKTLMRGGHLQDFANLQKILEPNTGAKGMQYDPARGILINKGTGEAQDVTKGGQAIGAAPGGSMEPLFNDQGDQLGFKRTPGAGSRTPPSFTPLPQGDTALGQEKTRAQIGQIGAQTGKTEAQTAQLAAGKPAKALTGQEETSLRALETILSNVDKLRNNVGASGALGYGTAERFIGEHTPFSAPQSRAYNQAYNEVAGAINVLAGNPRLKSVAEAAREILPKPGEAEAMNAQQAIQQLGLRSRDMVGALARTFAEEGKSTAEVNDLAKTYEAGPKYSSALRAAMQGIQSNPGQMDDRDVQLLTNEQAKGRLPQDVSTMVMRQRIQRGMISPDEYARAAQAHPELNDIKDEERVANPRPAQPPQAQPIPAQGGAAPEAQQTAMPGGPTNANQQSQLPQQIQQMQSQMAPPGGVNPSSFQTPPEELQRQQQDQQLIQQSRQMARPPGQP